MASWVNPVVTLTASSDSADPDKNPASFWIGVIRISSGGSDSHYRVFLKLNCVRNLTEEQHYKVAHQPLATFHVSFFLTKFCGLSQPCLPVGHLSPAGLSGLQVLLYYRQPLDRWGYKWSEHSLSFTNRWWSFQTPQPTPLKSTECCAGRNMGTICWGKQFPEKWNKKKTWPLTLLRTN